MSTQLVWQESAACITSDPEILKSFYGETEEEVALAKSICDTCPVKLSCLKAALDSEERFGVWGGSDESTRRWALSIDQYGKPIQRVRDMKCPNCGTVDINPVEVRKVRVRLKCQGCSLSWLSRKAPDLHPIDINDIESDDIIWSII